MAVHSRDIVVGLVFMLGLSGCRASRDDICTKGRARAMASSEFVEEQLVAEAAGDQRDDVRRIVGHDTQARDAVYTGLCEQTDEATLACIQRANAAFERANGVIARSCGSAPSVACRSAAYEAMEVGEDCGDRLLAFEMRLQEASRAQTSGGNSLPH